MRCPWCGTDPLYVAYHDAEWGVPVRDDARLFEMLLLEGAQEDIQRLAVDMGMVDIAKPSLFDAKTEQRI